MGARELGLISTQVPVEGMGCPSEVICGERTHRAWVRTLGDPSLKRMGRGRPNSTSYLSRLYICQVLALPVRILRKLNVCPLSLKLSSGSSNRLQYRNRASLLWHQPRVLQQALNRVIIHAIITPGRRRWLSCLPRASPNIPVTTSLL